MRNSLVATGDADVTTARVALLFTSNTNSFYVKQKKM